MGEIKLIGSGYEACVYKHKGKALKIFDRKDSQEISEHLLNINLQSIITPDEIVYDSNGNYMGYYMKLIENIQDIRTIVKNDLITSYEHLIKDSEELAKSGIRMGDLIVKNSLYSDNQIYLIDTSLYSLSTLSLTDLENENIRRLNNYLLCLFGYAYGSPEGRKALKSLTEDYYKYIYNNMNDQESLESFAKRIIKK